MRHTWNTGRLYTRAGQIMVAEMQPDGSILFHDTSRMIAGRIAAAPYALLSCGDMARYVDVEYLHNRYTHAAEDQAAFSLRAEPRKS